MALMMTLLHALELLTQYGVKSFYMFLKGILDNTDGSKSGSQIAKLKNEIQANPEMSSLFERLRSTMDAEYVTKLYWSLVASVSELLDLAKEPGHTKNDASS